MRASPAAGLFLLIRFLTRAVMLLFPLTSQEEEPYRHIVVPKKLSAKSRGAARRGAPEKMK
jgi:hypothetical protein